MSHAKVFESLIPDSSTFSHKENEGLYFHKSAQHYVISLQLMNGFGLSLFQASG